MRFCHAILNNHEVPTGFLRCCRVLRRDGFDIRKIGIVGLTMRALIGGCSVECV